MASPKSVAPMTRIAVAGAGRMGQAIVRLEKDTPDLNVTAIWTRNPDRDHLAADQNILVTADLDEALSVADLLIDFTLPAAASAVLNAAVRNKIPLVCGVSGLDQDQIAAIDAAAAEIAVLYDRNMSQGIAVLDAVLRNVLHSLGPEFSVEIHETHHKDKQDAPSGTALALGETIATMRGGDPATINYTSERHGEVPGDHTVIFSSPTERLEFKHSVRTRDVFAAGALVAARWLGCRKSGRYSMQDVLFGD